MLPRKYIANYLQRSSLNEGVLIAQVTHTGVEKIIVLLAATDANDADAVIERIEQVSSVAKRRAKLNAPIKREFATLYDQCLEQGKTKLEATNGREGTQNNQLLH